LKKKFKESKRFKKHANAMTDACPEARRKLDRTQDHAHGRGKKVKIYNIHPYSRNEKLH
jgi:hypothetical protein